MPAKLITIDEVFQEAHKQAPLTQEMLDQGWNMLAEQLDHPDNFESGSYLHAPLEDSPTDKEYTDHKTHDDEKHQTDPHDQLHNEHPGHSDYDNAHDNDADEHASGINGDNDGF